MQGTNPARIYAACCIALVATALTFSIRADIMNALKIDLNLTEEQVGEALGPGMWAFALMIFFSGFFLDRVGMGKVLAFAFFGHVFGVILTIFAKNYQMLYASSVLIGLANGSVEAVSNPLTATLFPQNKTKYLNRMHAWWPAGLVFGGLGAFGLTKTMGLDLDNVSPATFSLGWKIKMCLVLIPAVIYGVMMIGQKFPQTERVEAGVPFSESIRECFRPLFLIFTFLMLFTAATELGPDAWVVSLLEKIFQNVKGQGVLILVYTSVIMFVMRSFFAGPLDRIISPIGILMLGSIFSAIGLFWLGNVETKFMVIVAATIFGIGKSFFWPTMMSVVAERFPRGGALALCVIGAAGTFSAGWLTVPKMGKIQDHYQVVSLREKNPQLLERVINENQNGLDEKKVNSLTGPEEKQQVEEVKKYAAQMAYRWVAAIPAFLTVAFVLIYFYFKSKGGYKPVLIDGEPITEPAVSPPRRATA